MDSLLAVRLRTTIIQLLRKAQPSPPPTVPNNVVYDHPSIRALTEFILSTLSSTNQSEPTSELGVKSRVRKCVEHFTANLPGRTVDGAAIQYDDGQDYVVVTGTTGSLGSFLLNHLLDLPSVGRIYCFNRKSEKDTIQRQLSGFKDRGLDPAKLEAALNERVMMFDVDLSEPRLGLSDTEYQDVGELIFS